MYWKRLSPLRRGILAAIAAGGVLIVTEAGMGDAPEEDDGPAVAEAAAPQLRFVRWSHPSGLFSTDVPRGWTIDGAIGDAMELGQFRVNANSPDGRSHVSFAHNWLSFMEFQYGRYRPGAATVEAFVLPGFLREQRAGPSRVVYRSANRNQTLRSEIGLPIPFDSGVIAFLLQRPDGGFSAGTAMGETLFIASPGTPGLWRLRLFAAAVAPAGAQPQADARAAVTRLVDGLELSPEFMEIWNRAFQQTQQQMRDYSAQMDRVFSKYLASAARSASPSSSDSGENWATMMRGGQYGEDPETGNRYWITNDRSSWWVDDQQTVVGNDTGEPPAVNANWKRLVPSGQ